MAEVKPNKLLIARRTRDREFTGLTELHHVWDRVPEWHQHVIRTQAQTIKNLRQERDQMRRGYLRKIARLERRIAALTEEPGNG